MNGIDPKARGLGRGVGWRRADGDLVSCEEKLKVLDENLAEVREICQDAFEDALLMGCDEAQVRAVFASVIDALVNPLAKPDGD